MLDRLNLLDAEVPSSSTMFYRMDIRSLASGLRIAAY